MSKSITGPTSVNIEDKYRFMIANSNMKREGAADSAWDDWWDPCGYSWKVVGDLSFRLRNSKVGEFLWVVHLFVLKLVFPTFSKFPGSEICMVSHTFLVFVTVCFVHHWSFYYREKRKKSIYRFDASNSWIEVESIQVMTM